MITCIYFRNAVGKLTRLPIPEQAIAAHILHDLKNQAAIATFISNQAGCAVALPVLAVIN